MKGDKLSPRHEVFIREYLKDLNAAAAYERAGYKARGMSAAVNASKLLKNPNIQANMRIILDKRLDRYEVTAERVLEEIASLSFQDAKDLFEDDGSVKRIQDIPERARRAIVGFEVAELFAGQGDDKQAFGLMKKVKLADKTASLTLLAKYLKLLTDKVEISVDESLAEAIRRARERRLDGSDA